MIESISKLIKNKKYPPLLLMFGEEEFLLEEAYCELMRALTEEDGSNYDSSILDGNDITPDDLAADCSAYPFIAKRRVVVVNHFEKLFTGRVAANVEKNSYFSKYLQSPQPTTFLVLKAEVEALNGLYTAEKRSNKSKLEKILKSVRFPYNIIIEKYKWIEFPKVYESGYSDWITNRMKIHGKKISPEACELLIAQSEQSLRVFAGEIEKLLMYIDSRNSINLEDVSFLIGASRTNNVFELQKAVGRRELARAVEILENMLAADKQEMLILTMLTRYFVALWKLLEVRMQTQNQFQIAGKAGINPYFVEEYLSALRNYSPQEISNAFVKLKDADLTIKSTSTDTLYIMQKMLIGIMDKNSLPK